MSAIREHFSRFELKYLMHWRDVDPLIKSMKPYVVPDEHGDDGRYRVNSLYYDSPDLRAYFEKINGYLRRFKVRVRTYGHPTLDSSAFIEIKARDNQTVTKRRTFLTLGEAYRFMDGDEADITSSNPTVLAEIGGLRELYQLQPTLSVSYQRIAFKSIYEEDCRITFDVGVKASASDLALETSCEGGQHILPPQVAVLEVKVTNRAPSWLLTLLAKHECRIKRVSKYCMGIDRCVQLPDRWYPPVHGPQLGGVR